MISQRYVKPGPSIPFLRFLDTNGDGSGISDATGNYSVTPQDFYCQPGENEAFLVDKIIGHYSMAGQITQSGYAAGPALTNGVDIYVTLRNISRTLTNGHPIINNDDWLHHGFVLYVTTFQGINDSVQVTLDFPRPVPLYGNTNDKFVITLNDNFAFLTDQHFTLHGCVVS